MLEEKKNQRHCIYVSTKVLNEAREYEINISKAARLGIEHEINIEKKKREIEEAEDW